MKSNYTGVWLLLTVALVFIIVLSFCDDIAIGDWRVKKAPFREMLFAREDSLAGSGNAVTDSLMSAESSETHSVMMDSMPQSILLIGDSMTLNLAYRLAKYAKANGHDFHAVNWDSSNTKIWGESDTLQHFINEYNATYVFISLGANELYLQHPESRKKYVEEIIRKVGGRPYVWIGPPNWKEDAGLNDMIERTCGRGSFFRSAGMTFERKKDKVHPTRAASALWIDSVARWIPKSSHPILMEAPSDSLDKLVPDIVFLKALNK